MDRNRQSTYVRGLVIGALRADLRWVKTVIRIELEGERGCLTYDGLQTVWAFRQQLRLSGLTRGERIRLARDI
jgi:hypothetical protein